MTISTDNPDGKEDLLLHLTSGFEALMLKIDELVGKNMLLEQQVREYQSQYGTVASTDGQPVKVSSDSTDSFVEHPSIGQWRQDHIITLGIQAWEKLRNIKIEAVPLNTSLKPLEESSSLGRSILPDGRRASFLEQDFTTQGAKGDLKCPFTKIIRRRRSRDSGSQRRPHSLPTPPHNKEQPSRDPIAAEFHADDISPPPSVTGSVPKCPIRFLDDHSPEEIAKYFENHKHEIPRSHEVCVKRYQSNSESIRQLDAKYGSLVNMIQGLGMKHQPMLPTNIDKDLPAADKKSIEKVEHWAKNCADEHNSGLAEDAGIETSSEPRIGHFDRPLKEVRLGESPSRPWGIQIPYTEKLALSAEPQEATSNAAQSIAIAPQEVVQSIDASPTPGQRCPFGHRAAQGPAVSHESKATPSVKSRLAEHHNLDIKAIEPRGVESPRLVFNGPVFFNYSAQEASALLGYTRQKPSQPSQ